MRYSCTGGRLIMSTIKVNSIKNTSTDDGGIAIDNSGHVQIDGQQLPTAGALSQGITCHQRSDAGVADRHCYRQVRVLVVQTGSPLISA